MGRDMGPGPGQRKTTLGTTPSIPSVSDRLDCQRHTAFSRKTAGSPVRMAGNPLKWMWPPPRAGMLRASRALPFVKQTQREDQDGIPSSTGLFAACDEPASLTDSCDIAPGE